MIENETPMDLLPKVKRKDLFPEMDPEDKELMELALKAGLQLSEILKTYGTSS